MAQANAGADGQQQQQQQGGLMNVLGTIFRWYIMYSLFKMVTKGVVSIGLGFN